MNKEKFILFILAAAQFTHIMDFMIIMPLGEMLMDELSINAQQFSFVVAAYTLSAGVSGFLGAFYLDKFDRKKVFLLFYIGFTLGTLICAIAPNYELLLGARIFTGMFGAVISSITLSIVGDLIPYQRRAMALGIVMMAFSAASALGLPVGLSLAFNFGWNAPFWFLGVLSGGLTFLVAKFIPPVRKHLDNPAEKPDILGFFRQLPTNGNQLKSLAFTTLLIFGQFTMIPFITPYLVHNVGFEREQIVFVYLIGGLVTIVSNPFVGKWADRRGKSYVFTVMAIISIAPLILLTNIGHVGVGIGLTITALFFLAVSGRMVPAVAISTSVTKPQNRGSYMSIDSSLKNGAAGVSSIIAGLIVVAPENGPLENYHYVGYLAVFFTLLAIYLVGKIKSVETVKKNVSDISPSREKLALGLEE
ncbi:MAG: MFS transporter [Flammeovirgaceae bacterium]